MPSVPGSTMNRGWTVQNSHQSRTTKSKTMSASQMRAPKTNARQKPSPRRPAPQIDHSGDRHGDEHHRVQRPYDPGRPLPPRTLRAVALPDRGRIVIDQRVPGHQQSADDHCGEQHHQN
ncbi:hypothetical protein SVIO_055350 [Streptomyces violaceusniger]|uniref:Uncharacterized protein n=1 Tax=Streptomyces violaceusniger TaxID=68280 RepID=A0A4D4L1G7_STRVO|nr:hypothetical protein SVIO_055350 [Streptomyces violaceusniger]